MDIFPEIIFSRDPGDGWEGGREGGRERNSKVILAAFALFSNIPRTIALWTRKGKGCKRFTKMTKIGNLACSTIS